MKDYYAILDVPPTASPQQIKEQYHFLVQAWHPDRFPRPEQKAKAEEHLKGVITAYETLSHPVRRVLYDGERSTASAGLHDEEVPPPGPQATEEPRRHAGERQPQEPEGATAQARKRARRAARKQARAAQYQQERAREAQRAAHNREVAKYHPAAGVVVIIMQVLLVLLLFHDRELSERLVSAMGMEWNGQNAGPVLSMSMGFLLLVTLGLFEQVAKARRQKQEKRRHFPALGAALLTIGILGGIWLLLIRDLAPTLFRPLWIFLAERGVLQEPSWSIWGYPDQPRFVLEALIGVVWMFLLGISQKIETRRWVAQKNRKYFPACGAVVLTLEMGAGLLLFAAWEYRVTFSRLVGSGVCMLGVMALTIFMARKEATKRWQEDQQYQQRHAATEEYEHVASSG